ncbi:peroxiredoxin-like family protein [Sphingobacterium kitahiroshimense]|uniref:thioredoxin-dependent peroxiredoxin n=1 Tax=Sphingobacterium kitahiroshimense TaxID=470446 RepID=A0ABV0BP34_9SPHI
MKNLNRVTSIRLMLVTYAMACSIYIAKSQEYNQSMDLIKELHISNKVRSSFTVPQKPEDINPLRKGRKIPTANLVTSSGELFNVSKAVAEKPTILIVYRGGWCPYCTKQLSGLQNALPELEKLGYQLIAVSTDAPDELMKSVAKEKLNYTLLSDADLSLSKQLGIAYKAPKAYWEMLTKTSDGKNVEMLLPVPSVFILDTTGTIQFEYINPDFRERLNTTLLKAAAASIKK